MKAVVSHPACPSSKLRSGLLTGMISLPLRAGLGLFFLANVSLHAQDAAPATPPAAPAAVPAGKGAYAASIPDNVSVDKRSHVNKAAAFDDKPVCILKPDDRPIPSNHWHASLIYQNFGVGLWPYPLRVETSEQGFQVFYPTKWRADGGDVETDHPLIVSGKDFKPTGTKTKDWSDWMVSFRLGESDDKYIDATLGQGMPYIWLECHGVSPTIAMGGGNDAPKFYDAQGQPLTLPFTGDAVGIEYGGRNYGVFAPDGTKFEADGTGITATFADKSQFLVISPLPAAKDITYFHQHAFAVPRDTKLSWQYDPDKGTIATEWKITAEPLKGTDTQVIQGWLPHHYRNNISKLDFNGIDYLTGRGTMHCALGNDFTLTYPFTGILPNLPAPKASGGDHAFDPAREQAMLQLFAAAPKFGGDTYWGGKDLVRFGQAALIAKETNDPSHDVIAKAVHDELVNWFTYTPGKADHLFAYYPKKKGLVGFNSSFGSEEFTDNHFHYG